MNITNDTRIIFVHGLAAKPSDDQLFTLWKKALIENIRVDDPVLANDMESNGDLFRNAYWANAIPDHIEDCTEKVSQLAKQVDEVIKVRKKLGETMHLRKFDKLQADLKSKLTKLGMGLLSGVATALTIKDEVIDKACLEISYYKNDQQVADRIRNPLEACLIEAWEAGKEVVVISHSMGSFVAYDVLWRFSHRAEDAYVKYRDKSIGLFVTIGSPLADPVLRKFMLIKRWEKSADSKIKQEHSYYFPTNIERWQNYAAMGDIVCHDSTMEDDFFVDLKKHARSYGDDDLRDYVNLYNPYRNSEDESNPHKSYGYLVQPKLSYNIRWFFGRK